MRSEIAVIVFVLLLNIIVFIGNKIQVSYCKGARGQNNTESEVL